MDGVSHEKARSRHEPWPGCYDDGNLLAATAAAIVRRGARVMMMMVATHRNDARAVHCMAAVVVVGDVGLYPGRSTARAMVADIAATAATGFSSRRCKKRDQSDSQENERLFHDDEFSIHALRRNASTTIQSRFGKSRSGLKLTPEFPSRSPRPSSILYPHDHHYECI